MTTKFSKLWALAALLQAMVLMAPICSTKPDAKMQISSTAFKDQGSIPTIYTCEGSDFSPPLTFSNVPKAAESLVLIVDDPDAPSKFFAHWLAWNIAPDTTSLPENFKPSFDQGKNGHGQVGYKGPCPPTGTHRYFFRLYALNTKLALPPTTDRNALLKAMSGHILADTILMGTYHKAASK